VSAAGLLDAAAAAGVPLRAEKDGTVKVLARPSQVPPDLLVALRAHKAALFDLLTGRACRCCGEPIVDRRPDWLAFADRTAAHVAWRVETAEGVLAHFAASESVARLFASQATELNTDDRAVIEFGFARMMGRDSFSTPDILEAAARAGGARPRVKGAIDWIEVAANRPPYLPSVRSTFAGAYAAAEFGTAARLWKESRWTPVNSRQLASAAHVLALTGDEEALDFAEQLRPWEPAEADAIAGLLRMHQRRFDEAAPLLVRTLTAYRNDPWPSSAVMESALSAAPELAADPAYAESVLDALSRSYAVYQLEEVRRLAYIAAAWRSGRCSQRTLVALGANEPHALWVKPILEMRVLCYGSTGLTQLSEHARRDLDEFKREEVAPTSFSARSEPVSPRP